MHRAFALIVVHRGPMSLDGRSWRAFAAHLPRVALRTALTTAPLPPAVHATSCYVSSAPTPLYRVLRLVCFAPSLSIHPEITPK
ncbi:hypothetical protein FB451DRAFT_1413582 [Mycena latifolia]|nr:hypothetical protein FB451DRAFT_1413582 [Mycena latifolia]